MLWAEVNKSHDDLRMIIGSLKSARWSKDFSLTNILTLRASVAFSSIKNIYMFHGAQKKIYFPHIINYSAETELSMLYQHFFKVSFSTQAKATLFVRFMPNLDVKQWDWEEQKKTTPKTFRPKTTCFSSVLLLNFI